MSHFRSTVMILVIYYGHKGAVYIDDSNKELVTLSNTIIYRDHRAPRTLSRPICLALLPLCLQDNRTLHNATPINAPFSFLYSLAPTPSSCPFLSFSNHCLTISTLYFFACGAGAGASAALPGSSVCICPGALMSCPCSACLHTLLP